MVEEIKQCYAQLMRNTKDLTMNTMHETLTYELHRLRLKIDIAYHGTKLNRKKKIDELLQRECQLDVLLQKIKYYLS